jgi:hypothetical protein
MGTSTGIISNYLEDKILNHILKGIAYTMPTHMWLTVYTGDGAGEGNTGLGEITIGGYSNVSLGLARPEIDISAGALALDGLYIYNTEPIIFTQATTNWGTVTGWGLKDWSGMDYMAGNLLFWGMFDTPIANPSGNTLRIGTNKLRMVFSTPSTYQAYGWTTFSSAAMANWVVNGIPFDWASGGVYIALGRNVILNNTTEQLFSSWTEVNTLTCPSYSRKLILANYWNAPVNSTSSNYSEIVFTTDATESWGSITDVVLYDTTNTNPLFWGHLANEIIINIGDGFTFLAEELSVSID